MNYPIWLTIAALSVACTTVVPAPRSPERELSFSHAAFDRVLQRFVDETGRIDYAGLAETPEDLDGYFALLAGISPDSHPERFPSERERLAYWINAYNAVAIVLVLASYPIGSVEDVSAPRVLSAFFPDQAGFFFFRRFELGGDATNLYFLENRVIRRRFDEPRIHFALNCASLSCPRLPRQVFRAETLDAQLEAEARRFFAEERNLAVDGEEKIVWLSAILDWYHKDYLGWLAAKHPDREATLVGYVSLYAPEALANVLANSQDFEVRFRDYDWALNDQRAQ